MSINLINFILCLVKNGLDPEWPISESKLLKAWLDYVMKQLSGEICGRPKQWHSHPSNLQTNTEL